MTNKNLVLFSTHKINNAVISEYKKFLNIPDFDCILVCDNEKLKFEPEYSMPVDDNIRDKYVVKKNFNGIDVQCCLFDRKLHEYLKLPNCAKFWKEATFTWILWYNADYRFYYVKNFFPDYEYYWQFDYDVFMNGRSYEHFFLKYENRNEDLLITKFRLERPHSGWGWNDNLEWIYGNNTDIYGSFFPVSRLSNRAVDFLEQRRLEHGEIFNKLAVTEETKWANCEAFVPTELMLNGFSCANIDEPNVLFPMTEFDLSSDRIFENPDNMLYHPVKGDFISRIKNLNKIIEDLKSKLS